MIPKFLSTDMILLLAATLIAAIWMPGRLLPADQPRTEATARMRLESYYAAVIDDETNLEALARIASYAAHLSDDEARFMRLMNGLILDAPSNRAANWLRQRVRGEPEMQQPGEMPGRLS